MTLRMLVWSHVLVAHSPKCMRTWFRVKSQSPNSVTSPVAHRRPIHRHHCYYLTRSKPASPAAFAQVVLQTENFDICAYGGIPDCPGGAAYHLELLYKELRSFLEHTPFSFTPRKRFVVFFMENSWTPHDRGEPPGETSNYGFLSLKALYLLSITRKRI